MRLDGPHSLANGEGALCPPQGGFSDSQDSVTHDQLHPPKVAEATQVISQKPCLCLSREVPSTEAATATSVYNVAGRPDTFRAERTQQRSANSHLGLLVKKGRTCHRSQKRGWEERQTNISIKKMREELIAATFWKIEAYGHTVSNLADMGSSLLTLGERGEAQCPPRNPPKPQERQPHMPLEVDVKRVYSLESCLRRNTILLPLPPSLSASALHSR